MHSELRTDKHILIGKINLLISLQLGVSIKYLVNKLPHPKVAIMHEPEGKQPICYGCVCSCVFTRECLTVCVCNLLPSVYVYVIHHLCLNPKLIWTKLFHFFNLSNIYNFFFNIPPTARKCHFKTLSSLAGDWSL